MVGEQQLELNLGDRQTTAWETEPAGEYYHYITHKTSLKINNNLHEVILCRAENDNQLYSITIEVLIDEHTKNTYTIDSILTLLDLLKASFKDLLAHA